MQHDSLDAELKALIPPDRAPLYEYYKLEFLPDGYPGKRVDGELQAHPIYGAYLIYDFLRQYLEKGGEKRYLEAAIMVGDGVLRRLTDVGDCSVFYYEAESRLSEFGYRFYSALTQARYLNMLTQLGKKSRQERFSIAAERMFRSLQKPVSEGGVMIETPYGPTVEEYPHEIPLFVQNGWTSAILEMLRYGIAVNNKNAEDFARANLDTFMRLIERFDVPWLCNTRYQLTGFLYGRLLFASPVSGKACSGTVTYPTVGRWDISLTQSGRFHNWFLPGENGAEGFEGRQLKVNLVLSRITDVNEVELEVELASPAEGSFQLAKGTYNPLLTAMPSQGWESHGTFSIGAGVSQLRFPIDTSSVPLLGYPTNFTKKISGKNRNVYHFLHIRNLEKLHAIIQDPRLLEWAARWTDYARNWPNLPEYAHPNVELTEVKRQPPVL